MTGSKKKFPKAVEDWFESQYPEYDLKLGVSKPHLPGRPAPQDDDDLKEWKEKQGTVFEEIFKEELKSVINWKKRFERKWYNRTRAIAEQQRKVAPSAVQLPPILIIDHPSRSDGRRLFEESNTKAFSEQATANREAQGQSSKHHAGHWQAVAAAAWQALSDDERDNWEQKAKMAGSVIGSSEVGTIYENQKTVRLSLFQFLKSYTGTGSRQIGNAAFHLLYGFRGESDHLELGSVEISDHDFLDEKFSAFIGDYDEVVGGLWRKYCEKAIGLNSIVNYETTFNKSSAGWFILPEFDEENGTNSALRSSLKVFIEASWNQIWPRSSGITPLPWDIILDHPTDFLNPPLSTETIFGRPESMNVSALRNLSAAIVEFQTSPQTLGFSIFRPKSNLTDALLRHRAQMEGAAVEEVDDDLDLTAPGSPAISTSSLRMPSSPSPQVIPASDPDPASVGESLADTTMSSRPPPVLTSPHVFSAVNIVASGPPPRSISGTIETPASPIPSLVVPPRSPLSKSPLSGSVFASIAISNSNLSAVDSSTDALPMTENTPKLTRKRKRHHPVNDLKSLPTGSRTRKLSKKARGLEYDELTSDEGRQHLLGESSKSAKKRRPGSRAK